MVHAAHHAKHAAEAVEERHGDADAVARREVLARANPEAVVPDVVVRELDAFREARGPGGVLHVHHVVRLHLGLAREVVGHRRLDGEGQHFVERIHPAVLFGPEEHHAPQVRVAGRLQLAARLLQQLGDELVERLHIVAVAVAVDDEDVLGVRLLQGEVNLRLLVVDVEREEDCADLGRREHQRDPVRDVCRPERDLLAALDAHRHQPAGEAVNLFAELIPCEAVVAVGIDERVLRPAARDGLVE